MVYHASRYKATGANAVDATGQLDTVEFMNVAKDDALAWPNPARRRYPKTVNDRMESTIIPFVRKSLEVNNTFLEVFAERLGLPPGDLLERHRLDEFSGSEARVIRNPPTDDPNRLAIGGHTDFGTLVSSGTMDKIHDIQSRLVVLLAQQIRRFASACPWNRRMAICQSM